VSAIAVTPTTVAARAPATPVAQAACSTGVSSSYVISMRSRTPAIAGSPAIGGEGNNSRGTSNSKGKSNSRGTSNSCSYTTTASRDYRYIFVTYFLKSAVIFHLALTNVWS
jgi:hypothetical protein